MPTGEYRFMPEDYRPENLLTANPANAGFTPDQVARINQMIHEALIQWEKQQVQRARFGDQFEKK